VTEGHGVTAAMFSLLGGFLTFIWGSNNRRSHEYIRYWWEQIKQLENPAGHSEDANTKKNGIHLASNFESWRLKYRKESRGSEFGYAKLIRLVPLLFGIGWGYLFAFNLRAIILYNCH
jgi:hypothetical protein